MKKIKYLFLTIFLFSGCNEFMTSFKEAYNNAYKENFRVGFLNGCIGERNNAENTELCECLAVDLLLNKSVNELKDEEAVKEYMFNVSLPKCNANNSN